MKKQITLLLLIASIFIGCKKEEQKQIGSIEVKISYFYNTYQGYKADTGADIYLFKHTGKEIEYNTLIKVGILHYKGEENSTPYDFSAEADVSGTAKISGVPYGKYLLVAGSKGRFTYSIKSIEVNSETSSYVKNFGYLNEFETRGESW